jgi:lysophospholipase L1-like esterase
MRSAFPLVSLLALVGAAAALPGCGAEATPATRTSPSGAGQFGREPGAAATVAPAPLTQLAILGDSVAAAAGVQHRNAFDGLLVANDDARYPDFAGKDLAHVASRELVVVDLATIAAKSEEIVRQAEAVPPNPTGRTLILMSVGLNDLRDDLRELLDRQIVADRARLAAAAIARIAAHFANRALYPHGYDIGVLGWYDPTDGIGRIPKEPQYLEHWICVVLALLDPGGNNLADNMRHYTAALARHLGPREDVTLIDLYSRFVGHGVNHAQQSGPYYRPEDPSRWLLGDCLHPNLRGHDVIRRLVWKTYFE